MPENRHGAASGLFGFSRAVGTLLGPLTAGLAIELLEPVSHSTRGYTALFAVAGAATLASYPLVRRLERALARSAA